MGFKGGRVSRQDVSEESETKIDYFLLVIKFMYVVSKQKNSKINEIVIKW